MKRISRRFKYDFTIYTCLLLALVLIGYSSYTYLDNHSYSLKEIFYKEEEKTIIIEEPNELKNIDKEELINNYILELLDEKKQDHLLTREVLSTWTSYEIYTIKYKREISKNYYAYLVNFKINNLDAKLPTLKNKELSTNEYIVISLNINILKDEITNEYSVKMIDIAKNN